MMEDIEYNIRDVERYFDSLRFSSKKCMGTSIIYTIGGKTIKIIPSEKKTEISTDDMSERGLSKLLKKIKEGCEESNNQKREEEISSLTHSLLATRSHFMKTAR